MLRLTTLIRARPSMTIQTVFPATNKGKPLSRKLKKCSISCAAYASSNVEMSNLPKLGMMRRNGLTAKSVTVTMSCAN